MNDPKSDVPIFESFENLAAVQLGEWAPKPTATTPNVRERSLTLWSGPTIETGIWECEPGVFTARRDSYSELCYLISGRVTISNTDGDRRELGPGDVLVMPSGWVGTWEVHEVVRKHYTLVFDSPVSAR